MRGKNFAMNCLHRIDREVPDCRAHERRLNKGAFFLIKRRADCAASFASIVGRSGVKMMEPPVKALFKMKAPQIIEPSAAPPLANALANFRSSQAEVRVPQRVRGPGSGRAVRFANPFIRGIRFSVATGLHVITRAREAPPVAGVARAAFLI